MRHYERSELRHLNDGQRYRDHEYLADDTWVGANEHDRNEVLASEPITERVPSRRDVGQERIIAQESAPQADRYPFVSAILHPVRTIRRAIAGIFAKKHPSAASGARA